ncbi:hypothetical protein CASFOL_035419 [Castilleja foliolosa]|uniref:F-box/LRR-repeat protein 15/At3g58940/PEG3-like LRR domain-containing protein n=1 Tax=Castilleja foliolosa TaxID=1961234 RepID=A0ABD3BUW6_9LAMI
MECIPETAEVVGMHCGSLGNDRVAVVDRATHQGVSELQQHVMEKMLSGCPVLRGLVLIYCCGFDRLETIFQSAYVKQLTLRGCTVAPRGTIEWPSLTKLHIEGAELQQHVIEKILSGCPVLHCLVLELCRGFNRLEVCSKSLYELCVNNTQS